MLELGRSTAFARKVSPSPARLYYVMGALEAQIGELGRARPLLDAAVRAVPTVEALMLLASIDRQRGATKEALGALGRAIALGRAGHDEATIAEALLMTFEIQRARGERASAERPCAKRWVVLWRRGARRRLVVRVWHVPSACWRGPWNTTVRLRQRVARPSARTRQRAPIRAR